MSAIIQTDRLILRQLEISDAAFILELVNQPSWLEYIGDKGIHSFAQAAHYIESGPRMMYREHCLGLYLAELNGVSIGMCGLLKRITLIDIDIGFAFLHAYWGKGYALEAATAMLSYAHSMLKLKRIVAISNPGNIRSVKLLEKLGLKYEKTIKHGVDMQVVELFGINF